MKPLAASRVPRHWGEDHIVKRMPDGNGFMRDTLAPGGCIYRVDPDGKDWELISNGYRNPSTWRSTGTANCFVSDADMEWDISTRGIVHSFAWLPAARFGWRMAASGRLLSRQSSGRFNVGPARRRALPLVTAQVPRQHQEAMYPATGAMANPHHLTRPKARYKGEIGSSLPACVAAHRRGHQSERWRVFHHRRTQDSVGTLPHYLISAKTRRRLLPVDDRGSGTRALSLEAFLDARTKGSGSRLALRSTRIATSAGRARSLGTKIPRRGDRPSPRRITSGPRSSLLALVRVSADDPFHRPAQCSTVDELKKQIFSGTGEARLETAQRKSSDAVVARGASCTESRLADPMPRQPSRTERLDAAYPSKAASKCWNCVQHWYFSAPSVVTNLALQAQR